MRAGLLLVMLLGLVGLLGCSDGSTIGQPCSATDACASGEVCDYTAEGGAVCASASGDDDGDGLTNDKDFCLHAPGGATDEDVDGIGDVCDKCPVAAPRATPDPDGDEVDSPCDPDPREPGDSILLFDPFTSTLDTRWRPTTASAWEVRGGELRVNLSSIPDVEALTTTVIGKASISIEASYRVDRLETTATEHRVAVSASDPRPAGTAQVDCGVRKTDVGGGGELVVVETNQSAMSQIATGAFDSARLYRAGAYVTRTTAGCSVIADGDPLGTVQAAITPDQLASVSLVGRAASARFQWILIVGR